MAQTLVVCMSNPLHRLVCERAPSVLTVCKLPEREFCLDSLGNLGISCPESRAEPSEQGSSDGSGHVPQRHRPVPSRLLAPL